VIIIYCDGSCRNSQDKKGGWGAILMYKEYEKRISGSVPNTTSNRMELLAALKALKALKRHDLSIQLHSDSQYLIKGMSEWSIKWVKNGWTNANNAPVINKDLWLKLLAWNKKLKISWIWVRGHAGHRSQEIAHDLAQQGLLNCK
jgi:ribonuclease HI